MTVHVAWRGSVSDLITDLACEMTAAELCELRSRLNNGEGLKKVMPGGDPFYYCKTCSKLVPVGPRCPTCST